MAGASEDALLLSARIRARGEDDEEEKASDAAYDSRSAMGDDARASRSSSSTKTQVEKDRRRATSDASSGQGGNDSGDSDSDREDSTRQKRRHLPLPTSSAMAAMRSPSRLATSLLVGRDRMARAAKAWRDGARRAGLFGGDDDEEDEDDGEEAMYKEEKKNEWGTRRARESRESIASDRGSEAAPEPILPPSDQNPAEDEADTRMVRHAGSLPLRTARLMPARLMPATRLPKMAQLWAWLDRIECISIRDVYEAHDDVDDSSVTIHYVLDVYNYQEQHSLPTHRYRGPTRKASITVVSQPPPLREPDYHIQHRFSSFTKLRSRLLKATHRKHPRGPTQSDAAPRPPSSSHRHCTYCQKLTLFLAAGNDVVAPLGWRAKFFTTVEMRKALLSQFVSQLVLLAREHRDACSNLHTLSVLHQPPSRYVHRSVPGILRRFLTVQTGENFMR